MINEDDILKIAKEVNAILFKNKSQMENYKRRHNVRPTTKLEIEPKSPKMERKPKFDLYEKSRTPPSGFQYDTSKAIYRIFHIKPEEEEKYTEENYSNRKKAEKRIEELKSQGRHTIYQQTTKRIEDGFRK